MTASSATPVLRINSSVAGMRGSAKAKRSRTWTGEVWWLRPMTMSAISLIVDTRQETETPECKQDKRETGDGAPCKATAALGEAPMEDQQGKIECPNDEGPDDFGIGPIPC